MRKDTDRKRIDLIDEGEINKEIFSGIGKSKK